MAVQLPAAALAAQRDVVFAAQCRRLSQHRERTLAASLDGLTKIKQSCLISIASEGRKQP